MDDAIRDKLIDDLKNLIEEETKEFVDELDKEFLKNLASAIAKQTIRAKKGGSEGEHAKDNLKHLNAQLKGEIARSNMKLIANSGDYFEKAIRIIIAAIIAAV